MSCAWAMKDVRECDQSLRTFSFRTWRDDECNDDSKMGGTRFFLFKYSDSHVLCLIIYLRHFFTISFRHSITLNNFVSHLLSRWNLMMRIFKILCKQASIINYEKLPSLHIIYFRLMFCRSMIIMSSGIMTALTLK